MEMILYTVVAVALYLAADHILNYIERMYGGILPYRSVIFFAIILVLATVVFDFIKSSMKEEPIEHPYSNALSAPPSSAPSSQGAGSAPTVAPE